MRNGNRMGKKRLPKAVVVVLNWNGYLDTLECVESIMKSDYGNLEIVVVDNGSDGDDVDILKKRLDKRVTVIENKRNYGFAAGNNIGIRHCLKSGFDYIVLLNNDTIVEASTLGELVAAAETIERSGIVTPIHYSYRSPSTITYAGRTLDRRTGLDHFFTSIGGSAAREVEVISGTCMALRRTVLERIGLLPEDYFFFWEDADYSIRAARAGFRNLVVPTARIWHKVSASTRNLSEFTLSHTLRGGIIFWRRYAGVRWPYYACFLIARLAARFSSRMGFLRFVRIVSQGVWDVLTAQDGFKAS